MAEPCGRRELSLSFNIYVFIYVFGEITILSQKKFIEQTPAGLRVTMVL